MSGEGLTPNDNGKPDALSGRANPNSPRASVPGAEHTTGGGVPLTAVGRAAPHRASEPWQPRGPLQPWEQSK